MIETEALILRSAVFDDWEPMLRNIWSHAESARYMLWNVTDTAEKAQERIRKTIDFEKTHPHCWLVIQKSSMEAIGFAGMDETAPGVYTDMGIAIGPSFTGKGYGKQILNALTDYAKNKLGAHRFTSGYRIGNEASRRMQASCGFQPTDSDTLIDPRTNSPYILQYTQKNL